MGLLAFMVAECGYREKDFWLLTPAKLLAIVRAKRESIKRDDYRTGILTAIIRAAFGQKNPHPFDYFPQHKEASAPTKRGITSAEQVRQNLKAFMKATKKDGKKEP